MKNQKKEIINTNNIVFNEVIENNELDKTKNNKRNNIGKNKIFQKDKFRFLSRSGLILDSYDENESEENSEFEGYLINCFWGILLFIIYSL